MSAATDRDTAAFAPMAAGNNLLGEACRVEKAAAGATAASFGEIFEIRCGDWEQPSARLVRSVSAASLDELAASSGWRTQLDELATCNAPHPTTVLGNVPALELECAVKRGGWPYRALVTRVGDAAYLGDSIPATEPVLERSIALLAKRQLPPSASGMTIGVSNLDAPSAGKTKLYSAGDLASYRQLLHLAQYHNYVAEYPEAEKLYRRALSLQDDRLSASGGSRAYVLMSLALELSNQERFLEADAMFAQAEAAMLESFDETDEARLTSYRAIHYANQKRGQKAIDLAREASDRRMALAGHEDKPVIGAVAGYDDPAGFITGGTAKPARRTRTALLEQGETALGDTVQSQYVEAAMLIRQDRLDDADATLALAMSILEAEPRLPRRWGPQISFLQALIAERRGDWAAAEASLVLSIPAYRALSPDSRNEALALLALGRVQNAQGRTDAALQTFRSAFAILQSRRDGIVLEDALPYFDTALSEAGRDAKNRQQLLAEVFAISQLIRSTRTQQSIALASARLSASDQTVGKLIREMQDARRKRDDAAETLARAQADPAILAPQLRELEERWRALSAATGDLERQVQAAAPRYHQLLEAPAPAGAAPASLRQGEALVQILVGNARSLVLFVDADGIDARLLDYGERDAERDVTLLRAPFDQLTGAPFDVETAHALFRRLFAPVAERLARAEHLIVVPSGPLLSLPFGVLITEPPGPIVAGDYSQVSWLAKNHAVTLAPSVQALVGLRGDVRPPHASKPLIGFGDFIPQRDVQRTLTAMGLPETCRAQMQAVADMPRLPATAGELQAVQAALHGSPGDLRLRQDFTEAAIKAAPLADYRVVYFATHALLPHDFDCWAEPLLITSASGEDDGLLLASEVAELDLDADLVVLSACNTAAPGGGSGGESLTGLARAFFYAGARSLLVTHWPIPDVPTQMMMTRLFGDLAAENLTTAEALRRAQSALIATPQLSHPLNWAAFSLVGDGGQRLQTTVSTARSGSTS